MTRNESSPRDPCSEPRSPDIKPPLVERVDFNWLNALVLVSFLHAIAIVAFMLAPRPNTDLTEDRFKHRSRFASFNLSGPPPRPRRGRLAVGEVMGRLAPEDDPKTRLVEKSTLNRICGSPGNAGRSYLFGTNGLGGPEGSLRGVTGAGIGDAAGLGDLGPRRIGPGGGGLSMSSVGLGALGTPVPVAGAFGAAPQAPNPVIRSADDRRSTFAVDVDTAAYSMARRAILDGGVPHPDQIRVEEMINYFRYDYEPPRGENDLFSIQADGARSPVDGTKYLLRVGIQAKVVEPPDRLPANLVFLVDTSCSMTGGDRLELAKYSIEVAADRLSARDRVAIATYAGGSRLVLEATPADQKEAILSAVRNLSNGGGTAMESGMLLAYRQAMRMRRKGAITRVIVLSDGDANIGATTSEKILKTIGGYVKEGITLSTIGYGRGNYQDARMEQLANDVNGNYFYVDSPRMAERIFGRDLVKMIQDVAQALKIQVEMDPEVVSSYRLVGYENRDVADRDFRNDDVDAAEIGAGHQVTALYELTMNPEAGASLATVRVRAKRPGGDVAKEAAFQVPVGVVDRPFARGPEDLRFAVGVMGAAELLRRSPHAKGWTFDRVLSIIRDVADGDLDRRELIRLVELVKQRNRQLAAAGVVRTDSADVRINTNVALASLTVMGAMSRELVRRVFVRHAVQIGYCYEKERVRAPGIAGRVATQFTVSSTGLVQSAKVTGSTIANASVERCIKTKIRTWQFPKSNGGGGVIVRAVFDLAA